MTNKTIYLTEAQYNWLDQESNPMDYAWFHTYKNEFRIYAQTANWLVLIPRTYDAMQWLGAATTWDPATNRVIFDDLVKWGPIYVNHPKNTRDLDKRTIFYFGRAGKDKLNIDHFGKLDHFFENVNSDYSGDNPRGCLAYALGDAGMKELDQLWMRNPVYRQYQYVTPDEALVRVLHGESINQVFEEVSYMSDGIRLVRLNGFYNYLVNGERYLTEEWFADAVPFSDGFAIVQNRNGAAFEGKYNERQPEGLYGYIDKSGRYPLGGAWFDACEPFRRGFGVMRTHDGYGLIDGRGKYPIGGQYFKSIGPFIDGVAAVQGLNGGYGYLKDDGEFLIRCVYDYAEDFYNGRGIITCYGKQYEIYKDGTVIDKTTGRKLK